MTKYFLQTLIEYAQLTNQMNKSFIEVYNVYNANQKYWNEVYEDFIEAQAEGWADYQGGIL